MDKKSGRRNSGGAGSTMRKTFLPYGLHDVDESDIKAVAETLRSDWITTGPKIGEFEEKTAKYVSAKHGIAVNSGTAALEIAVSSLGLPEGSEVITTPFTFVATSNSILYSRLKPVFADIRKDTFNISLDEIKKKITEKTRAILFVDYAGQPCEFDEIKKIAEENSLFLIEDAAQALGASYKGKKVGSLADLTCFSFHPVKTITTGEGGMVTTNDEKLAEKLKMLRNHGIDRSTMQRFGQNAPWGYDMKMLGRNFRMTDFQAALGISQLGRIEPIIKKREALAAMYNKELERVSEVRVPFTREDSKSAWHLYTILLEKGINRNTFYEKMREMNIGVNVHYMPVYRHSYYRENFKIEPNDFPVTEEIFSRIITLPLFPKMNEQDILDVVAAVKKAIKEIKNGQD